jgi:glutathione S-transferase
VGIDLKSFAALCFAAFSHDVNTPDTLLAIYTRIVNMFFYKGKPMLLYDMTSAMNPRRVRIFLAEKGLTIPTRQTPVLELDDGTLLTESIAICRYLEALHPEKPLFGRTALEQAQIEMWTRRIEFEIVTPIITNFRHTGPYWIGRVPQEPACGEFYHARALEAFEWLDRELVGKEFIATDHYTIADIVAQCGFLVGKATGTRIPPELKELTRWYAAMVARPTARA